MMSDEQPESEGLDAFNDDMTVSEDLPEEPLAVEMDGFQWSL